MTDTYEDLCQRIRRGDDNLTPAQLDEARREADYKRLQEEAARAPSRSPFGKRTFGGYPPGVGPRRGPRGRLRLVLQSPA